MPTSETPNQDACPHDDLVGYWVVQVSGDVLPGGALKSGNLDTEMSDIYGQVREGEPVEISCRDCGAILSGR